MAKHKKQNKLIRYLIVFKRRLKRLNRKKIKFWFKSNLHLKQHPFIFGLAFLIWINNVLSKDTFEKTNRVVLIKFHIILLLFIFIAIVFSNILRDKQKVKWYAKKRFVFTMLLLFTPLGLILLWSGTKFRRITKIVLSVVFGLSFIVLNIYSNRKYERLLEQAPIDRIVGMISKPKRTTFLKTLNQDVLSELKIATLPAQRKSKLAVSDIASLCSPAVVSIETKDKYGKELGMGSGFIISKDGVIVTNFHVVDSAYQAEVKIGDAVFKEVYLIKGIPNLDMAVLKIDAEGLPVLSIGDSDNLVSGQFIIVLGNPAGLERSVSSGIISAVRSKGQMKVIQMTAPVSPGSSGGPVINEYGEVIGITTLASFFMAQNLNFAIPINYLEKIIKEK